MEQVPKQMKRGKPLKRSPMKRSNSLKRSPLKQGNSLKRTPMKRTWMKKGKHKTKYARRERDIDFMGWVKTQPCLLACVDGAGPCAGVVEADHAGDRGMGQKSPDDTCIPLCTVHHTDRHSCTGFFRGRPKPWKREWRHAAIAKTQAAHRLEMGIEEIDHA